MYIGKRSTNRPIEKDNYLGSGVALRKALKKYGRENFSKYIIDVFDSSEAAYTFEKEIIEEVNAVSDKNYYNLVHGGPNGCEGRTGELHPMFGKKHSPETIEKMRLSKIGDKNYWYGKHISEETKRKLREKCGRSGEENSFYGKKHTTETRNKLSSYAKKRTGDKNSFYGKSHTDETKKKISQKNRGKLKDIPKSEEQKKKMSLSNKKRREIIVYGEKFLSITEASKHCGIERHKLSKIAKDANNDDIYFVE